MFSSAPASKKLTENVASLEARLQTIGAEEARLVAAAAEARSAAADALLSDPGASLDRLTAAAEKAASEAASGAQRREIVSEALATKRGQLQAALDSEQAAEVSKINEAVAARIAKKRAELADLVAKLVICLDEGSRAEVAYESGPGFMSLPFQPDVVCRDSNRAAVNGPTRHIDLTFHLPALGEHRAI